MIRNSTQEITIDFSKIDPDDEDVARWLAAMGLNAAEVDDLTVTVDVDVDIEGFDDDEIANEYAVRFGDTFSIEGIYRLLAEGNLNEAMDLMSRVFNLAEPSHERRVVARIAAGRQGMLL